jgi:hypothetical protein
VLAGLLLLLFGSASFGAEAKIPFSISIVWECRLEHATNSEALVKFRDGKAKLIHLVSPICLLKDEQFAGKLNLQDGDALGVYLSAHKTIVQAAGVSVFRDRPTFWGNETIADTQGDDVWLGAYAADDLALIVQKSTELVAKLGKVQYVAVAGGLLSPALTTAIDKQGFVADLSQFSPGLFAAGSSIGFYPLGKWLRGEEMPESAEATLLGNRPMILTNLPPLDWASPEQIVAKAQATLFASSNSNSTPLLFRFHVESAQKYAEPAILTVQRLQELAKSANLVLEPVSAFESQALAAH